MTADTLRRLQEFEQEFENEAAELKRKKVRYKL
jgi:hypothetical protein